MSERLPHGRVVMTANEAAAYAVVLARAQAIGCYPITPQTLIVERLAELVAGRDDVEFANLESEHSMFGYVIAAARAGVRTFTATSSQGLLYAHEQLHRASRERVPLVVVNVNRAVFAPWSLEPDLSDSMSQRDTGWIQLYCSSAQEVLDSVLCAYRIAETVMLPVMVCAEGFLLSHTSEVARRPDAGGGRRVHARAAPAGRTGCSTRTSPRAFSALPEPRDYAAFQRNVAEAMDDARGRDRGRSRRSSRAHFGREKIGALELAGNPDAEHGAGHDRDDRRHGARAARRRRRPARRPRPRLPAVPGRGARVRARRASRTSRSSTARPRSARSGRSARDVRSLDLRHATRPRTSSAGWAAPRSRPPRCAGRSSRRVAARPRGSRRVRPGGGVAVPAWLDEIVSRGAAAASRPRRLRRLRARDQRPPRARRAWPRPRRSRRSSS